MDDPARSNPDSDATKPLQGAGALGAFLEFLKPPRLGPRGWGLIAALGLLVWLSRGIHIALPDLGGWIGGDIAAASTTGSVLQIVLIDLLLSGDNAVVIALACRRLPPEQARRAAWIGAGAAIVLRVALTMGAGALMQLPFLQLLSALPLLIIALNLMTQDHDRPRLPYEPKQGLIAAAGLIVLSDLIMSIDNVVAVAAVSRGSLLLLTFGLLLSIPLIVYGSFGLSSLMRKAPILIDLGSALLGWVAGQMIADDPLVAGYTHESPALELALPLAGAAFVWLQGRWVRAALDKESPEPTP